MAISKATMKELFKVILDGMRIHEQSYSEGEYRINLIAAMQKASGDVTVGYALYLMSHNWNDLQDIANEFGVGFNSSGDIIDLPPRPTLNSFWDCKEDKWKDCQIHYKNEEEKGEEEDEAC